MTLPLSPEAVEAAQESIADYMAAQDYAKLRASEMAALAIDAFLQVEGFEVEGKYAVQLEDSEPDKLTHRRLVSQWVPDV